VFLVVPLAVITEVGVLCPVKRSDVFEKCLQVPKLGRLRASHDFQLSSKPPMAANKLSLLH